MKLEDKIRLVQEYSYVLSQLQVEPNVVGTTDVYGGLVTKIHLNRDLPIVKKYKKEFTQLFSMLKEELENELKSLLK